MESGNGNRDQRGRHRPRRPAPARRPGQTRHAATPRTSCRPTTGESVQQLLARLGLDPAAWRAAMAGLDSPLRLAAGAAGDRSAPRSPPASRVRSAQPARQFAARATVAHVRGPGCRARRARASGPRRPADRPAGPSGAAARRRATPASRSRPPAGWQRPQRIVRPARPRLGAGPAASASFAVPSSAGRGAAGDGRVDPRALTYGRGVPLQGRAQPATATEPTPAAPRRRRSPAPGPTRRPGSACRRAAATAATAEQRRRDGGPPHNPLETGRCGTVSRARRRAAHRDPRRSGSPAPPVGRRPARATTRSLEEAAVRAEARGLARRAGWPRRASMTERARPGPRRSSPSTASSSATWPATASGSRSARGSRGCARCRRSSSPSAPATTGPPGTAAAPRRPHGRLRPRRSRSPSGPTARSGSSSRARVSALELVLGDGEPPRVVVLAEDALMRLRMTRRMRTYPRSPTPTSPPASPREHGLEADVEADGPRYDVVQQLNQSDLAFLRERARLVQAELWCTGRTLHFRTAADPRGHRADPGHGGDQLLSVRLVRRPRAPAQRGGRHRLRRRARGTRSTSAPGRDVVEAEVSRRADGRRARRAARSAAATTLRVREAALTTEEARAWARAEMLRRGRRFVTVTGHDERHARHGRRQPAAPWGWWASRSRATATTSRTVRHTLRPASRLPHPVRGRARRP